MIPLQGERPVGTLPWVNIVLIAANLAAFVFFSEAHPRAAALPFQAGFVPRPLFHPFEGAPVDFLRALASLATAMFLHAGWLHMLGNMLYLWIFGHNVEGALGHRRYGLFYLLCGAAASLTHGLLHPDSTTPVVGASGAVAGVLAAYLLFFPRDRIKTLLFFGIFVYISAVPAAVLLGIWIVLQAAGAVTADASPVAWYAHLGGFLAGLLTAPLLRRRRARATSKSCNS